MVRSRTSLSDRDPKTPFVEYLTLSNLDLWSRSIDPRGAFLARVVTKISPRVDFPDGVVS